MTNSKMNHWYKIARPIDDQMPFDYFEIVSKAIHISAAAGYPPDFAVFEAYGLKDTVDNSKALLYFSPKAASLCSDLLKASDGVPSIPPVRDETFKLRCGNPETAWLLLNRDNNS